MYNSDDYVNGVSSQDCFHSILDLALDYQRSGQYEEAYYYFNIIDTCLGIDFSIPYAFDSGALPAGVYDSFEATKEYDAYSYLDSSDKKYAINLHGEIDRVFGLFGTMVQDGVFSREYFQYLLERKDILEAFINYQTQYKELCCLTNCDNAKKVMAYIRLYNLRRTKNKLDGRIKEVEANLNINEDRGKVSR